MKLRPRERKEAGQGHRARSQARGKTSTMTLIPYSDLAVAWACYTGVVSPPQSVCSNTNTEKLIGVLCVAYGFSDTLYMVTCCWLTHSFSGQLNLLVAPQATVHGLPHLSLVFLFGFISHPALLPQFIPATFHLHWFRYLSPLETFPSSPKIQPQCPSSRDPITAYITHNRSGLPPCLSPS